MAEPLTIKSIALPIHGWINSAAGRHSLGLHLLTLLCLENNDRAGIIINALILNNQPGIGIDCWSLKKKKQVLKEAYLLLRCAASSLPVQVSDRKRTDA